MDMWTRALAVLAAVIVLGACGDVAGTNPIPEQHEIRRVDYASDSDYRKALREAAIREMWRMPPNEFAPFVRRNGWKERWPNLWGEKGWYTGSHYFQPPEALTPRVLARIRNAADRGAELGFWTREGADARVALAIEDFEARVSKYIGRHAREWEANR